MTQILANLAHKISSLEDYSIEGRVCGVKGLIIEVKGINAFISIGSLCTIEPRNGSVIKAEVVGIKEHKALLMPFEDVSGIGSDSKVSLINCAQVIYPSEAWRGRIINCFGEPIDGKGALPQGEIGYALKAAPPKASERTRVREKMDMGVRSIDVFTPCCRGQRLGIFAGSGVGKSVLLSMFAKFAAADVKVIGLIGERGREVNEFIEDYLGEEGLKDAVVVVATSDESALARRQAAYMTMAVSEYFRDQNKEVLTMMDSVTRFAMALREIGLAAGEPPTSKGYTPSVFAELPKLLERAGPGVQGAGDITGIFSTLVEGDDTNEPIADAVRSILDGHIVLSREIAARGRFPSVDVLQSISRMVPNCNSDRENLIANTARRILANYQEMVELIRIGAYKAGSDPELDLAISLYPQIEQFLSQSSNERDYINSSYDKLGQILEL
ncbi:MAG: flagellar protein export ATPase FliI [Candidatus Jidaibacter sp.]|jgi:flagellum-specific ATP synthase|nr:flagellar protein export ATPase FliI [Candidatus Jidaibacter sp.]